MPAPPLGSEPAMVSAMRGPRATAGTHACYVPSRRLYRRGSAADGGARVGYARPMGTVAYLVQDLVFTGRIEEVAGRLGVATRPARDADSLAAAARDASLVLLDLRRPDALAALDRLAVDPATARVRSVGFVGHEELAVMDAARSHGCTLVLPKGKFASDLPTLLAEVATASANPPEKR